MNINFTEEIEQYIERKLESGLYGSAAELVREAMREKIEREVREEIESRFRSLLLDGIDLGPPEGVSADEWTAERDSFLKRIRQQLDTTYNAIQRGEVVPGPQAMQRLRDRLQERYGREASDVPEADGAIRSERGSGG